MLDKCLDAYVCVPHYPYYNLSFVIDYMTRLFSFTKKKNTTACISHFECRSQLFFHNQPLCLLFLYFALLSLAAIKCRLKNKFHDVKIKENKFII